MDIDWKIILKKDIIVYEKVIFFTVLFEYTYC